VNECFNKVLLDSLYVSKISLLSKSEIKAGNIRERPAPQTPPLVVPTSLMNRVI